jgi:hypothetical protein
MKTIRTKVENSRRYQAEARSPRPRRVLLDTDCNYGATTIASFGGRCVSNRKSIRSFRKISDDYFQSEAPQSFVAEAAVFGLMVLTSALPLFDGASALASFLRATGAL